MADFSNPSDSAANMAAGNPGINTYEHHRPAYRYGVDAGRQHVGRAFHEVEGDLERGWHQARRASDAAWQDMKHAARDAFERVGHR